MQCRVGRVRQGAAARSGQSSPVKSTQFRDSEGSLCGGQCIGVGAGAVEGRRQLGIQCCPVRGLLVGSLRKGQQQQQPSGAAGSGGGVLIQSLYGGSGKLVGLFVGAEEKLCMCAHGMGRGTAAVSCDCSVPVRLASDTGNHPLAPTSIAAALWKRQGPRFWGSQYFCRGQESSSQSTEPCKQNSSDGNFATPLGLLRLFHLAFSILQERLIFGSQLQLQDLMHASSFMQMPPAVLTIWSEGVVTSCRKSATPLRGGQVKPRPSKKGSTVATGPW